MLDANDAPVIAAVTDTSRYEENPSGLPLLDGLTVVDHDTTDFGGGQLLVDISAGRRSEINWASVAHRHCC